MPAHIRKFKPIECEDIEEYVEYIDEFKEEKENEEEKQDIDESYVQVINEEDTQEEDHLRWQDNVVVVANKEHLPIDVENYELLKVVEEEEELVGEEEVDVEREEQTMYIRSKQNNNKNALIINDSSQEAGDRERNTHDNNSTVRKRHVGSYSCDYCHRVYPNYSRMKTHRRCHETDRQKFSCSHCGRIYATKQARDCHVQTVHDKFGYTCDICNKVFAIRKSLEIHIRYHTGDFPYKCYMCDRKFAQSCHLNTHINVKHNKIRFSCDYPNCGKCFTSSSSLRNHEFTHGIMPFECKYCQQGFPAKSKLRVHIHRKHGMDMTNDQLEEMRKFHIMRSKVNLVQFLDS